MKRNPSRSSRSSVLESLLVRTHCLLLTVVLLCGDHPLINRSIRLRNNDKFGQLRFLNQILSKHTYCFKVIA